jgi:hypothetical protein
MKCSGRWVCRDDCIPWRFKHELLELNRFLFIVETEGKSRAIERDFLVGEYTQNSSQQQIRG